MQARLRFPSFAVTKVVEWKVVHGPDTLQGPALQGSPCLDQARPGQARPGHPGLTRGTSRPYSRQDMTHFPMTQDQIQTIKEPFTKEKIQMNLVSKNCKYAGREEKAGDT